MQRFHLLAFTFAVCTIFSYASIAHAESVLWNTTIPGGVGVCEVAAGTCSSISWQMTAGFNNPDISVQYRAFVTNADTGTPVPSGSSVPVGTKLKFTFDQHLYTDISWFAVGSWLDSPYGDWGDPNHSPPYTCSDKDFVGDSSSGWAVSQKTYAPLTAAVPAQQITGLSGDVLSCGAFNGTFVICTAVKAGSVPAVFDFQSTNAMFHAQWIYSGVTAGGWAAAGATPRPDTCLGTDIPMLIKPGTPFPSNGQSWTDFAANSTYSNGQFSNPGNGTTAVVIPEQTIPYQLTVTAVAGHPPTTPSLSAGAACTVATQFSINMTSTDPDGDNLKYGVDWDNDGSVDQWVPPAGYVLSGTTQTASRTYSIAGSKTVKVLAQDSNGLSSGWANYSFTCAPASMAVGSFNNNNNNNNNTNTNNNGNLPPAADLQIRVIPSLVHPGDKTKVNWSATNVTSCAVTAPNGDIWNTIVSVLGGETSKAISQPTTYTLKCIDLQGATKTKTATVRILPNFQEL